MNEIMDILYISMRGNDSQKRVEHSMDNKLSVPTILAEALKATLLQFLLFIIRSI